MIVAYATEGPYETPARNLRESLKKLKLECQVDILPSKATWRQNTHIRPKYLLGKLAKGYKWLLSIDADAVVLSDPLPYLKSLDCDIAVHYIKKRGKVLGEMLPGTLWLQNTKLTIQMLKSWAEIAKRRPEHPDRFCCRRAVTLIKEQGLKVVNLPPEYTYVFDASKKRHPNIVPIIKHMQASRKLRRLVNSG